MYLRLIIGYLGACALATMSARSPTSTSSWLLASLASLATRRSMAPCERCDRSSRLRISRSSSSSFSLASFSALSLRSFWSASNSAYFLSSAALSASSFCFAASTIRLCSSFCSFCFLSNSCFLLVTPVELSVDMVESKPYLDSAYLGLFPLLLSKCFFPLPFCNDCFFINLFFLRARRPASKEEVAFHVEKCRVGVASTTRARPRALAYIYIDR